jgi:hypothetical protein
MKRPLDETDPDSRDPGLDTYDPRNPNQPPYTPQFVARYRTAQLSRMRRRTASPTRGRLRYLDRNSSIRNDGASH